MATKNNAAQAKAEVAKLITKLQKLHDKSTKEARAIRRMLRKFGHKGGVTRNAKVAGKPAAKQPKASLSKKIRADHAKFPAADPGTKAVADLLRMKQA